MTEIPQVTQSTFVDALKNPQKYEVSMAISVAIRRLNEKGQSTELWRLQERYQLFSLSPTLRQFSFSVDTILPPPQPIAGSLEYWFCLSSLSVDVATTLLDALKERGIALQARDTFVVKPTDPEHAHADDLTRLRTTMLVAK